MLPLSDPDIARRRFPIVTVSLVVLCAVFFIYELALDETSRILLFYRFGLIPSEITQGVSHTVLQTPYGWLNIATPLPDWATLFTSMFLHGDWMHFLSNMLYLWVFGSTLEDRFGRVGYLLFYLAAGLIATGLQIAVDTGSQVPNIGASGAIAGILGAYLVLYPLSRIRTVVAYVFITFIRIPAWILLGFWILLQFAGGMGSLGPTAQTGGIAYWAHIGGFLAGVVVVLFIKLVAGQTAHRQPTSWRM